MSDDLAPIPRDAWPSDWHPFEDNKSAEERAEAARIYDAEKARTRKQRRGHYEAPKSASQPDDPDTGQTGANPQQ